VVDTHIAAIGAIVHIGPRIVPLVAAVVEIVPMKRLVEMAIAIPMKKLNHGRLSWTGTPEALLADAAEALWTLIVPQAEFERVRARYRVSSAIPRGGSIETRILAAHQPHPQARPSTPTLEEAYLLFQEGIGQAEGTEPFPSPKPV
jgi:hypothetical protein